MHFWLETMLLQTASVPEQLLQWQTLSKIQMTEKKNTQTLTEIATEATETCYVQLAEKISLLIFNFPNLFHCKEQQRAQGQVHASTVYTASQNKVQNNYGYRLISAALESSLSEDYHMICKIFISNNITPGDSTGKCKATPEPMSWFTQERTCPLCTPKFEQQKEYMSCQLQAYKSQSCCIALSYLVTFLHSSTSQIPAKLAILGVCLPSWFSPCEFSRTLLSSGVIYIPAMPCYLYYRSLPVDEGVLKLEHGNIVRGETSMELFPAASPWAQPSLLLHGPWSTKHTAHTGLPKFTVCTINWRESPFWFYHLLCMTEHPEISTKTRVPWSWTLYKQQEHLPAQQHASYARATQIPVALAFPEVPTRNWSQGTNFLPYGVIHLCKNRNKESFFS